MIIYEIPTTLFFAALILLISAFLFGRYTGLKSRWQGVQDIETLQKILDEEKLRLETQTNDLRKDLEGITKEGIRARESIKRWETIKSDHDKLGKMQQELEEFELQESNRIDELERRRSEAATRLLNIQTLLDQYPPEILQDESTWGKYLSDRKKVYDELQNEFEIADADLKAIYEEQGSAQKKLSKLESRIDKRIKELKKVKDELNEAKNKNLTTEAVNAAKIQFPDDSLSVIIKDLPTRNRTSENKLVAFRYLPECLKEFPEPRSDSNEESLLIDFGLALKNIGLEYHERVVRAFHTALKVNDLSPLTVLSGLSGTGKSQLPRAYTQFFGINFLHVPVEPGWDSPQDILGFYDFVAERYRPPDRARALGFFDPNFAKDEDIGIDIDQNWSDRMLVILLDEMNLARTEYYFSEFLSRLEMRGPREYDQSQITRIDAQIAIDLPYGEDEQPKHLYVPHNVLWVGTLNEDETTQTLSDKVLDRANSIRFSSPKPTTLTAHSTAPKSTFDKSSGYLPYEVWLEWSNRDKNSQNKEINNTLAQLASLMQEAGRGFGYRITQSIRAYVDRYPGQDWRPPMIDQINMRLLPKLAGTEMQQCQISLDELARLCEDDLGDEEFSKVLYQAIAESQVSQTFTWLGYTYESN